MEYQVQINNVKTKLQDTRARKKQQEELIMKVENQALKVNWENRFQVWFQNFLLESSRTLFLFFHRTGSRRC